MLPEKLQENIYKLVECRGVKTLKLHSQDLTQRYKKGDPSHYMDKEGHRLAYLLTRMPATYAAIKKVLEEIVQRIPFLSPKSFLDLGAGPGTGMWAAKEIFPQIALYSLLEKDGHLLNLGKLLAEGEGKWIQKDIEKAELFDSHELVLLSYALGELKTQKEVVLKAWNAAQKLLILIEPGTPTGFSTLKKMRQFLIDQGAYLVAPCPHSSSCPLQEKDWCHFSARLSRSSLHRQMKNGSLGYEDEKFFYLVFSKTVCKTECKGRILRHPQKKSGYVEMVVCTEFGVQQKNFSRKEKEEYKWARKAEWGDRTN